VTSDELNLQCIADLKAEGLREKKFVAVVGSGPSLPYIASVTDLIAQMSVACGVVQTDGQPTWDFFENAYAGNAAEYVRVIRESLGNTPYWDSRMYAHIVRMPFRSFVTLNYEDQLPYAFRTLYPKNYKELFSVYPPWRGCDLASPADLFHKQRLVAIHGYRDKAKADWPNNIILKRSDYNHHYFSAVTGRRLQTWWKDTLTRYPCLFIGTSLTEPGIERVINWLIKDENPEFGRFNHIHLKDARPLKTTSGVPAPENPYPEADRPFGVIRQLRFDPLDGQFSGLLNILATFSGQPVEDPEPGMPALEEITPSDSPPI
jgi:hypothetical protein